MANYALVVDNKLDSVYDYLPKNWKNISNFDLIDDWAFLNSLGWQQITKIIPSYDPATQKIEFLKHELQNEQAVELYQVINLPQPPAPTPPPPPAPINPLVIAEQIVAATQERLDTFARTRAYDGILSACTYALEPNVSKFKQEGEYCVLVRGLTWAKLYQILAEVQAGVRPMPMSYGDIESELPTLEWPV